MDANLTSLGNRLSSTALDSVTQSLANRASPLDGSVAPGKAREAAESFEAFFLS